MNSYRRAQKGVWLSIISYTILSVVKIWVGLWSHSLAVMADGLNNVSDILLSVAILIGLKVADQPADQDHPFGHNKAESISTLIAACFMALIGINIWIDVVRAIFQTDATPIHPVALYVSILSAVIMFCIYLFNIRLSKKTNSYALRAAALDNRSDSFVSLGAALGILGSGWGYAWIDPLAAFIVGGIIFKTAYDLGKPTVDQLMDGFDEQKRRKILDHVLSVPGIDEVRELRARNHGPYVFVELTIGVSFNMSVEQSHIVTEEIEKRLIGFENIRHVHIHVEPVSQRLS